jgi:hypothetical protein
MSRARRVAGRLYGDYVQSSRLREYALLLELALAGGYEPLTLLDFARRSELPDRVLLLRHDVDTDVPTAVRMWEVERRLGIKSTYFFRLQTWFEDLVGEVGDSGCLVGYHYEELSTLMKRRGVVTKEGALQLVPEGRDLLRVNLLDTRRRSGLPLDVLASHGDFTNRRTGVANWELLKDDALRAELGVELEAYDSIITSRVDARSIDRVYPETWRPADPAEALLDGKPVVEILVHPRPWGGSPRANAREDIGRLIDGSLVAWRSRRAR